MGQTGNTHKKILLVEDETVTSTAETKIIAGFGYEVIPAFSGEDAVKISLEDDEIRLVLMDINLGEGIDGTEAARRIMAARNLPIVFLTSHSEKEYVDRVREITRYGYIIKNSGNFVLQSSIEMAFELFDAHQRILEKEEQYRKMVEAAPFGIAVHSHGVISYINPAGMNIIGYRKIDDAIGEHLLDRVHPDSRPLVIERMQKQLADGHDAPATEEKLLRTDGGTRFAEVSAIQSGVMGKNAVMTFFNDITDRRNAEHKAEEVNRRLQVEQRFNRLLFDTSPAYIVAIDFSGKTLMMNKALLDILEYSPKEVRDTDYLSTFVHPDDRQSVAGIFNAITFQHTHTVNQNRIVSRSGNTRLVEWHGRTVKSESPEDNFFVGVGIDITERTKSEELVRDWKDRYKLIVEASGQVAYDYGTGTGEILWASSLEKILGYGPDECRGGIHQWEGWLHPDDRDQTLKSLGEAEANCAYWDTRYRLRHKNGGYVWVRDRGFFIPGSSGKAVRQLGMMEDITDRMNAEDEIRKKNDELVRLNLELGSTVEKLEDANEKLTAINNVFEAANEEFIQTTLRLQRVDRDLRSSEARLRAMVTNISDVIAIIDADGTIVYKSDNIEKIFGWKPAELVGLNYAETAHPDDVERIRSGFTALLKQENASTTVEYRYKMKDGGYRTIHLTAMNLVGDPDIRGVLANYHDITNARLAEQKIQKLLTEKELLLKEVHHRIKNNMNTIMSLISLQSEAVRDTPAFPILCDANSRIQSMMVLYDRLYHSENLSEMSVRDYLSPLVDEIVRLYPHRGVISTEKNIGDFVLGIKHLPVLGIMINELLTNSMKHAFKEKQDGLISLSVARNSDTVRVVFEDNGSGLPESVNFETSPGLGLQIVGILAKQIDGVITIDRSARTRFILEFKP
ncbi:MAG TPA: PAS domain S-box protein [Spirochaetota bacterium]|nr:PAS domain S-box protein [Spirochaetota bacterium]HRZ28346.1 PAS domain S-box protein [Spirochaetota bacterium]